MVACSFLFEVEKKKKAYSIFPTIRFRFVHLSGYVTPDCPAMRLFVPLFHLAFSQEMWWFMCFRGSIINFNMTQTCSKELIYLHLSCGEGSAFLVLLVDVIYVVVPGKYVGDQGLLC